MFDSGYGIFAMAPAVGAYEREFNSWTPTVAGSHRDFLAKA